MINIELLRKNPDLFRGSMRKRNLDPNVVDEFLVFDTEWRAKLQEVEALRAEQKKLGAARKIEEAKALKEKLIVAETGLPELEKKRLERARRIPNLVLESVPVGTSEAENVTLREVGKKPKFAFAHKKYVELSKKLDIIDTARAGKVSGSRFGYIKGDLARLEFALVQFAFDTLTDQKLLKKIIAKNKLPVPGAPFIPVIPPIMVKCEMMEGMGYVERGSEEIYFLEKDNLYLVGTSEQSIGPMHADETFYERELPKRYLSFSTCFRREAGSYGKDTKGILRVHQFNKLEMFSLIAPDFSENEHRFFLALEEYLMQKLELPYRVLNICSGDLGDPAAAKYDIETWFPGEGEYRETHSTSNTTDYQSRRLGIRYRSNRTHLSTTSNFVHLINGTAFSERPLLAILENYQTEKGTVRVPKVLVPYCGFREITKQ